MGSLDQAGVDITLHYLKCPSLLTCRILQDALFGLQVLGDQGRVLDQSFRTSQGLSGSPLMVLIREVWEKLQQFEFRSMHGVHGGTDLHEEGSDAHAS